MLAALVSIAVSAGTTPAAAQVRMAAAEERPTLRAEAAVTGPLVRIGDLVAHAGAAADIPIFRAPDLGHLGFVQASRVIEAIRPHRLADIDTGGIAEIAVTRASRVITAKDLATRIAAALAGQQGLGEAKDLAIGFDREVRPVHVEPSAAAPLLLLHASVDRPGGRYDVTFEVPTSGAAQRQRLRYTGTVNETVAAVVLARPLARGDTIKAADLLIERRPKSSVGTDVIQAVEQVAGFAVRRSLRAGELVRTADLMKPEMVRQNETVTILFEMPGMLLSVRGKALESGAEGDLVNVTNTQSKRTVQGTVTGPGRVTIASPTPHVMPATAETTAAIAPASRPPQTE